jgi:hypothetical protein
VDTDKNRPAKIPVLTGNTVDFSEGEITNKYTKLLKCFGFVPKREVKEQVFYVNERQLVKSQKVSNNISEIPRILEKNRGEMFLGKLFVHKKGYYDLDIETLEKIDKTHKC